MVQRPPGGPREAPKEGKPGGQAGGPPGGPREAPQEGQQRAAGGPQEAPHAYGQEGTAETAVVAPHKAFAGPAQSKLATTTASPLYCRWAQPRPRGTFIIRGPSKITGTIMLTPIR